VICKNCGTEIANKAIVCFRCGQATFEAVRKAPAPGRGGFRSLILTIGLLVLVLAGLFMGQVHTDTVPPVITYTITVLAAIVLAWRLLFARRRRRR